MSIACNFFMWTASLRDLPCSNILVRNFPFNLKSLDMLHSGAKPKTVGFVQLLHFALLCCPVSQGNWRECRTLVIISAGDSQPIRNCKTFVAQDLLVKMARSEQGRRVTPNQILAKEAQCQYLCVLLKFWFDSATYSQLWHKSNKGIRDSCSTGVIFNGCSSGPAVV